MTIAGAAKRAGTGRAPSRILEVAIAAAIACGVAAFFAWETLAWPLGAYLGILAFFRDPLRVTPQGDQFIVSPADGMVTLIQQVEPPRELVLDDGTGTPGLEPAVVTRISIFMSVFMSTSTARESAVRFAGWSTSLASL